MPSAAEPRFPRRPFIYGTCWPTNSLDLRITHISYRYITWEVCVTEQTIRLYLQIPTVSLQNICLSIPAILSLAIAWQILRILLSRGLPAILCDRNPKTSTDKSTLSSINLSNLSPHYVVVLCVFLIFPPLLLFTEPFVWRT